jgi:hypothetical protein
MLVVCTNVSAQEVSYSIPARWVQAYVVCVCHYFKVFNKPNLCSNFTYVSFYGLVSVVSGLSHIVPGAGSNPAPDTKNAKRIARPGPAIARIHVNPLDNSVVIDTNRQSDKVDKVQY